MAINEVAVVGAGTMGHGIAQICAQAGLHVRLYDVKDEFVQTGLHRIDTVPEKKHRTKEDDRE